MSTTPNPFTTVFAAQRTALEQTRTAFTQSVELQRRTSELLIDALDASEDLHAHNLALARQATEAYFDAIEAVVPGDTDNLAAARTAALEHLDRADEFNTEARDASIDAIKEGLAVYESVADTYVDGADTAFDAFLTLHEHAEDQFTTAADAVDIEIDTDNDDE